MRKILLFIFVCVFSLSVAQESKYEFTVLESQETSYNTIISNDTTYIKDVAYSKERRFEDSLTTKYSGKDFTYIDDLNAEPKPIEQIPKTSNSGSGFSYFMSSIFPIILGVLVVLIILKALFNTESNFWNFETSKKAKAQQLISDHEDIDESDYEKLLQQALANKEYRLATRYYYITALKNLSHKNHIEYHKDKTNVEYQFEIKDKAIRSKFSYLSYVYNYIWYGEFPIDKNQFLLVEKKYQSFIKTIV